MKNFKNGFNFPIPVVLFGNILILLGLGFLYIILPKTSELEIIAIGFLLLLSGVIFGQSREGVELNYKDKKYRRYISFLGLRTYPTEETIITTEGDWLNVNYLTELIILSDEIAHELGIPSHTIDDMSIETGIGAYLATPDLSAWVYLKSFRSLSEAKEKCPKLAEEIEVSWRE